MQFDDPESRVGHRYGDGDGDGDGEWGGDGHGTGWGFRHEQDRAELRVSEDRLFVLFAIHKFRPRISSGISSGGWKWSWRSSADSRFSVSRRKFNAGLGDLE